MRYFSRLNAAALMICFTAVIGSAVFCTSPLIRAISLVCAVTSFILSGEMRRPLAEFAGYGGFFLLITLMNPVIVTLGDTPLFYLAGRPYTLEALLYGGNNALAMIGALLWFRAFSALMTSDKLGSLLTSGALTHFGTALRLTLRFVPDLRLRYRSIREAHKAAGLLAADTWIVRLRSELNVFMSLTAVSLELSARTADSMRARGYTLPNRSTIAEKRFRAADILLMILSAAAVVSVVYAVANGRLYGVFYPTITTRCPIFTAAIYAALCAVPPVCEIKERVKWSFCAPVN